MARGLAIGRAAAVVGLLGAAVLLAQDWKTMTKLDAVDLAGLSPVQTRAALRLLRTHDCTCGCEMKVAECRVKDPGCGYSRGLSAAIVEAIKAGKSENDAIEAAKASRFGKGPQPPKLLEDAVTIPVAGSPVKGPADARVTLVEFSDFQCPYCSVAVGKLNAVLEAYPKQVKLIFKQFPLDTHSQAFLAAAAAIAAQQQGKFWQLHDQMFANRTKLSRPEILQLAQGVGLDMKRFTADLDSPDTKKTVLRDQHDGDNAGVEGTPTVYVNGQKYNGALDLGAIKTVIDGELKKK